jgi:hypothetical protein
MSEAPYKDAIVLDTNFIIENVKTLTEIVNKLSEKYDVYVTEISINERISQKYLEMQSKYNDIEVFKAKYTMYATTNLKKPFDERFEADKQFTVEGYNKQFGDKIIPFTPTKKLLIEVMDRVYKKTPPFINADKASDKGFKDTLLWISIICYFKTIKKDIKVILVTNDKGFKNSEEALKEEFLAETNKAVDVKENSYYKEILGQPEVVEVKGEETRHNELSGLEREQLREEILRTIMCICLYEYERGYGEYSNERTFASYTLFTREILLNSFENMENVLDEHIFEATIWASTIWGSDFSIKDEQAIPMSNIEALLGLYKKVKSKYIEYINPFLNAICEYINNNNLQIAEDTEMPF